MEGVVNLLKPPGMTSSNAVSDVKRIFGAKRVGHTGTLDPGAAGVLPICLGRATRLFDILVDKRKTYLAEIAFGARTDTQDSYGRITEEDDFTPTEAALKSALPVFLGKSRQIAPAYSALKINGKPMHELARKGEQTPQRVREIEIDEIDYIAQIAPNRFLFRVVCSRGTYVRTLCEDIGRSLGACAHLSFLLRTQTGPFSIENTYSVKELEQLAESGRLDEAVIPIEEAVRFLPAARVPAPGDVARLRNGLRLRGEAWHGEGPPAGTPMASPPAGALCRVYAAAFLGVGEIQNDELRLKLHIE